MSFSPDSGINHRARRSFFTGPRLAGLSGAFSAPAPMNTFWGGATAGLAGSLGGAAAYAQNTHEQEKEMLRQMMEERRLAIEQSRATEDARHNLATESVATAKEPDWTVSTPQYGPTESGAALPPVKQLPEWLQGVPPAGMAAANQQYFEKKYAVPKEPKPAEDTSWIQPFVRTTRSGKQFLDVSELQGKDQGAAMRWAGEHKIPAVGKDVGQLQDVDVARGNIEDMQKAIEGLLPKDAQGRVAAYPGIRLSKILQTSPQRAAFDAWRGAAVRNFRAVAGSKGLRMNEAEIKLAVENDIPKITDTYEVGLAKMRNVQTMLDNAESPILNSKWGGNGGAGASGSGSGIVEWVRGPNGQLVRKGQ